jgi:hypothetical protein
MYAYRLVDEVAERYLDLVDALNDEIGVTTVVQIVYLRRKRCI